MKDHIETEVLPTRDKPRRFPLHILPYYVRIDRYRDGKLHRTDTCVMDSSSLENYRNMYASEPGFRRTFEPFVSGFECDPEDSYDHLVVRIAERDHVASLSHRPAYTDFASELSYLRYALQCDADPVEIRDGKAIFVLEDTLFADDWAFEEWEIDDVDGYRVVTLHYPPVVKRSVFGRRR